MVCRNKNNVSDKIKLRTKEIFIKIKFTYVKNYNHLKIVNGKQELTEKGHVFFYKNAKIFIENVVNVIIKEELRNISGIEMDFE